MIEWFFEDSDTWLRLEDQGKVVLRFELGRNNSAFRDVRPWGDFLAVGWSEQVLLVNPRAGTVQVFELGDYFGYFHLAEDCLLACSGRRVYRFDSGPTLTWTSPEVGLDGVIVEAVADGLVLGSGEWDPPGGWRDFQLDLATGQEL